MPTVLTGVSDLEDKLANALIACRAAIKVSHDTFESEVSSDDCDDDDDDLMDDDEYSSEEDDLIDDDDDADDEEAEETIPLPVDIDTYERRIRRVSVWRDAVAGQLPVSGAWRGPFCIRSSYLTAFPNIAPSSPAAIPAVLNTCLSRKRKADCDSEVRCYRSPCRKARRLILACAGRTCRKPEARAYRARYKPARNVRGLRLVFHDTARVGIPRLADQPKRGVPRSRRIPTRGLAASNFVTPSHGPSRP